MATIYVTIDDKANFKETFEISYPDRFSGKLLENLAVLYGYPETVTTGLPSLDRIPNPLGPSEWLVNKFAKQLIGSMTDLEIRNTVREFELAEKARLSEQPQVTKKQE